MTLPARGSSLSRDQVQFTFRQELDHYDFKGVFNVAADPQIVWQVLTDYNHFSNFISNMHCHIRQQDGNDLMVQQTVGGGFLFIREEIKGLLKVHEEPFSTLSLQEISQKSFKLYQGSWKIKPDPSGNAAVVTYELEAEKNSRTPQFVTPDLFRQSTEDLMVEMKREIERREAKRQKEALALSKQ
jgi:ribosome-associated toxin RatA of RatAB toxin-antitoxin module